MMRSYGGEAQERGDHKSAKMLTVTFQKWATGVTQTETESLQTK